MDNSFHSGGSGKHPVLKERQWAANCSGATPFRASAGFQKDDELVVALDALTSTAHFTRQTQCCATLHALSLAILSTRAKSQLCLELCISDGRAAAVPIAASNQFG